MFSIFNKNLKGVLFFFVALLTLSSLNAQINNLGLWDDKTFPTFTGNDRYHISGMAYGNDTFVIAGERDIYKYVNGAWWYDSAIAFVATSTDGEKWTLVSTGSTSESFNSVIFSNGRFIAVCKQPTSGNARIWVSDTNGRSWVTKSSDDAGLIVTGGLHAVASDGSGKLIAAGGTPFGSGWATVSNDNGNTWRVVRDGASYFNFGASKVYGVGYANGLWFAVTSSNTYRSTDGGLTWTQVGNFGNYYTGCNMVASDGTTVVIATSAGPKWSSNAGVTWFDGQIARGFTATPALNVAMSSVIYEDGLFVMASRNSGYVWTSETGRYWKRWRIPTTQNTYSICYAKKAYWCAGDRQTISKSPSWFKPRLGTPLDNPFTVYDYEDGAPRRIGLPTYKVNTASLNLIFEGILFYANALPAPINLKLVYNSKPTPNGDTSIGNFGKNWQFKYNSYIGRFGQEAILINGGGKSITFRTPNGENLNTLTSDVILLPPDGIFDTLKYIYNAGTPRFELTVKSSRLTYVYGTKGTGASNADFFYLSRIKDPYNNFTDFTVTASNGRLTQIINGTRIFNFTYDINGMCTQISIPGGRNVSFAYDTNKNLIRITDMMGYQANYVYDDKGFINSVIIGGNATEFTYLPRPGYEKSDVVENKDDKYVNSITRPNGQKTTYELDADTKTVKRKEPSGKVTVLSSEKDGQTSTIQDPLGNLRSIKYNKLKLPELIKDEKGGVFTYEYDDRGNLIKQTDALGNSTTFQYDSQDNLIKITDANGKTRTFGGYVNYRPTTYVSPLGSTNTFEYNAKGLLIRMTDARGKITNLNYDSNGNLTSIVSPTNAQTTYAYDAQGFRCTSMTDPNGNTKTLLWDNNDRLQRVTYTTVAGSPFFSNTYNVFGQIAFTNELGRTTQIERDELGMMTKLTDPVGNFKSYEYDLDGRLISTTDPNGKKSTISYDNSGRPILHTDNKGYKITKEYDSSGNITLYKDKNNAETKYTYDKNNRLITSSDPLKKTTKITRDKLGRVSTVTNGRGLIKEFTYDDEGRLVKKVYKNSATSAPTLTEEFTYDANGNILTEKNSWGTTTYQYDDDNRPTKITYPDNTYVNLTYFNAGQLKTISYSDGLTITYSYDTFNRMPVPSVLRNNAPAEMFGEKPVLNLTTSVNLSGPISANFVLTYNNAGQLTGINRNLNTFRSQYTYDNAGRLTQIKHMNNDGSLVYFLADASYDKNGNIISQTFSGTFYYQSTINMQSLLFAYNTAGQLTKKGTLPTLSDADGNLVDLGGGQVKCTFDAENRLTTYVKKQGTTTVTTENLYNFQGLRVKKTTGNNVVQYHYLPSGIMLYTTDGTGNFIDRHIYAGGRLLATYKSSGQLIHYYEDLQANVRYITDNSGSSLAKYDYLPFGQYSKVGTFENYFTFNGILGTIDDGDSLFCMGKRFYDASTCRFLSRDPLGYDVGSNLYSFAANNPLLYSDPTGAEFVITTLTLLKVAGVALTMYSAWKIHKNANENSEKINKRYREEETQRARQVTDRFYRDFYGGNRSIPLSDEDRLLLRTMQERERSSYGSGLRNLSEQSEYLGNRLKEGAEMGCEVVQGVVAGKVAAKGLKGLRAKSLVNVSDDIANNVGGPAWDVTKEVYNSTQNEE